MPQEVILEREKGYISIRTFGDVTGEDMQVSGKKAAELMQEHKLARIIMETAEPLSLPGVMDLYQVGSGLRATGMPGGTRIAIVQEDGNYEGMRFFSNVASNRGVRTKIFRSHEEAVEWLMV